MFVDGKVRIVKIQRFSLHDGPGIRTTVFLKGCPLKCLWCSNPECMLSKSEIIHNQEMCIKGCDRCVEVCPKGCILLQEGKVIIDRMLCNSCEACANVCPSGALSVVGKIVPIEEVVSEVKKDKSFYDESGGGVTMSGGEPLFQSDSTLELTKRCKESGINVILDTCGFSAYSILCKISEYVDLIFYDIKHMDSVKHRAFTGVKNSVILNNLERISHEKAVVVRIPLIPGINDDVDNLKTLAEFIKGKVDSKHLKEVAILPYHRIGVEKYAGLGREYKLQHVHPLSKEHLKKVGELLRSYGLENVKVII